MTCLTKQKGENLIDEQSCDVVLERPDALIKKYEIVTANCIQTVQHRKTVCVRLANFTDELKIIPPGTNVARLVPISGDGEINYVNAYSLVKEKSAIKLPQLSTNELEGYL